MSGKILSGDDLEDLVVRAKEKQAELNKMVYIEEGHIVINVHYEYNVPLDRCDTHEKILAWALHLTEKTWMTMDVLERFIRLAMAQHGLEAPMP